MKTRVRRRRQSKYLLILIVLIGYITWSILNPLPQLEPTTATKTIITKSPSSQLTWPTSQAALSIAGTDISDSNNLSKTVPLASTAKIITALVVLDKKPLQLTQSGPKILITAVDVQNYKNYLANDGSVLPVRAGDELTEYQMLQALMLPSANNIADTLAVWAYGSLDEYAKAAQQYLAKNGIAETQIGTDASGLSADSKGTANDLTKLGKLAMSNPVLAEIVSQSSATNFPLGGSFGTIKNVNFLLGTQGIVGIKTGNSDEAGGAYVSASKTSVAGKPVIIVTAVAGAPNLGAAMNQSLHLIKSAQANFSTVSSVKAGEKVGSYKQPWGGEIPAVTTEELIIATWNGSNLVTKISLSPVEVKNTGNKPVGIVTTTSKAPKASIESSVILKTRPTKPSLWWRLTHPL